MRARSASALPGRFGTIVNDLALYGSWDLAAGPVVVTEGEKAADAVRAAGFAAVGTYGVGYNPSPAALELLRGRDVTLWRDADQPGREHMAGLAGRLAGIASSVHVLPLPADAPIGWDAADADAATIARLVTEPAPERPHGLAGALDAAYDYLRRYVVSRRRTSRSRRHCGLPTPMGRMPLR